MQPNWFIAFTLEITGLSLPLAPDGLRVFSPQDRHLTVAFLGRLPEDAVFNSWARAKQLPWEMVNGGFSEIRLLGGSAWSAIVRSSVPDVSDMLNQRESLCAAAGVPADDRKILPHVTLARMPRNPVSSVREHIVQWSEAIRLDSARFVTTGLGLFSWAEDRKQHLFKVVEHLAF